jgi:glucose dehydrogenase
MFDPAYRPGDNLYTNSAISWDPDTGNMNWYFQYTPGDLWDYDEVGTHILIDGDVAGQPRRRFGNELGLEIVGSRYVNKRNLLFDKVEVPRSTVPMAKRSGVSSA